MLKAKILKLKNYIFFKAWLCIFLSAAIFYSIDYLQQEYDHIQKKIAEVNRSLAEINAKITKESGNNNIEYAEAIYNRIKTTTYNQKCFEYLEKIQQLNNLSQYFDMDGKIISNLSNMQIVDILSTNNSTHIISNDLHLSFMTSSITEATLIAKAIIDILPEYSQLYFLHINKIDEITPNNIEFLKGRGSKLYLIKCDLRFRLRDIALKTSSPSLQ